MVLAQIRLWTGSFSRSASVHDARIAAEVNRIWRSGERAMAVNNGRVENSKLGPTQKSSSSATGTMRRSVISTLVGAALNFVGINPMKLWCAPESF